MHVATVLTMMLPASCVCRKFTENKKVAGASEEMHPLKELAEPDQVNGNISVLI